VFLLGLAMGMLILIRPVNILFVLLFVFYGVNSVADAKVRLTLLFKNWQQVAIVVLLCVLIFMPQLFYWKHVTGSYLFNSYVGERFYFFKPHLLQCLLGFKKGWLIYTPMIALALIGIYFLKTNRPFF